MSGIEIVGLIASVAGILTATQSASKGFKNIAGLPQAFAEVSKRIPLAVQILEVVQERSANAPESTTKALIPVVKSCKQNAENLEATLQKVLPQSSSWNADRYKKVIRSLGSKGRVEDLMKKILEDVQFLANDRAINAATESQMESLKAAVDALAKVKTSAPQEVDRERIDISHNGTGVQLNQLGDGNQNHTGAGHIFGNLQGANLSFNQMPAQDMEARKARVLRHLYTSPYEDRKDRNPPAAEGTCQWVITHPLFLDWQENDLACVLWISADPGCGKSVLSRHLVDEVLPTSTSRTTAFFFFKDDFEDQRTSNSALCCIIRQIMLQSPSQPSDDILLRFERAGDQLLNSFSELWEIFIHLCCQSEAAQILCVIDALDECADDGRCRLIGALSDLFRKGAKATNLKVLLTSRPYTHIRRDFDDSRIPRIHLRGEGEVEIGTISQEIDIVIRSRVSQLGERLQLGAEERSLLLQELTSAPNRTYLWVDLICRMIHKSVHISRSNLRGLVRTLPETVDEAYERILRQVSDHKTARRLLHMVVAAARPLSLQEMAMAFAIDEDSSSGPFQPDPVDRFQGKIRDLCGLFVTIIDFKIYFIHQTAKEFLVKTDPSQHNKSSLWKQSLWPGDSNRILALVCLRYLQFLYERPFPHRRSGQDEELEITGEDVLFQYSATCWAGHFRDAEIKDYSDIDPMLIKLCDSLGGRNVWLEELQSQSNEFIPGQGATLVLASALGIERLVHLLLLRDAGTRDKHTALSCAASAGHAGVIKLLLEAIPSHHVSVWQKAKLRTKGRHQTESGPLILAARNGREAAVKALLASDQVDINARGAHSRRKTALEEAVRKSHAVVVKLLLETGKAELVAKTGDSPLAVAVTNGNEAITRLLLDTGRVEVNTRDCYWGRTPLSQAVFDGNANIVKALLNTGNTDTTIKDDSGWTALALAVKGGHFPIVKMLLDFDKRSLDVRDKLGRTPFTHAVAGGDLRTTQCLLASGKADINARDRDGRTPLSYAAQNGYAPIVQHLINMPGLDIDLADKDGITPLAYAAGFGNTLVVGLLLATGKVDINARDWQKKPPLGWAIRGDHQDVVNLLLESGQIMEDDYQECLLLYETDADYLVETTDNNADSSMSNSMSSGGGNDPRKPEDPPSDCQGNIGHCHGGLASTQDAKESPKSTEESITEGNEYLTTQEEEEGVIGSVRTCPGDIEKEYVTLSWGEGTNPAFSENS